MALELQDLMALQSMDRKGEMTPYEQVKVMEMRSKRPSGAAITGVALGGGALLVGLSAWVFGGMQANAKGKEAKEAAQAAKELAMAYYTGVDKRLDNIGALLESEVNRRISGDQTITQTITDTISGQQSASQSAQVSQTTAVDQTVQQIMTQTLSDAITGKSAMQPQPVYIYSAPQPCNCPGCGCGQ